MTSRHVILLTQTHREYIPIDSRPAFLLDRGLLSSMFFLTVANLNNYPIIIKDKQPLSERYYVSSIIYAAVLKSE